MPDAAVKIVKNEGPLALYKGWVSAFDISFAYNHHFVGTKAILYALVGNILRARCSTCNNNSSLHRNSQHHVRLLQEIEIRRNVRD